MTEKTVSPMPRVGDRLAEVLVRVSHLRRIERKEGDGAFHIFKMTNASLQIGAVVWRDEVDFQNGDYVRVWGDVRSYRDGIQAVVGRWELVPRESVNGQDLVPRCPRPLDAMGVELEAAISRVEDPWVRRLLGDMLLKDPYIARLYRLAPAAKTHHHPYLHGLLEHNLQVLERALGLAGSLAVDRSLIAAGALLHDIGKIEEYAFEGDSIEFTEVGNLIGHIALGYYLTRRAIERIEGFPSDLATGLLHLLLAHQGRLEWGSPVEPKTAEAFILHEADSLDAHLYQVTRTGLEFPGQRMGFSRSLGRVVLGNPHMPGAFPYDYARPVVAAPLLTDSGLEGSGEDVEKR